MLNEILKFANITSKSFEKLIFGDVEIPIVSSRYEAVEKNYFNYPPTLVPIFSDYDIPVIIGILMHPFSSREPSFVRYNLEEGYFREIGMNSNQILTQMILEMIMIEDEITENISKFCDEVEFHSLEEVSIFSDLYGDNGIHYDKLVNFQNNRPLQYCDSIESYYGRFLSSDSLFNRKAIEDSSSFELSDRTKSVLDFQVPVWFTKENLVDAFYDFLNKEQFRESWLCLNSGKWEKRDLVDGLLELRNLQSDILYNLLCDYWLLNND